MNIAIIGGGIGGLTMALALKKADLPFKVFEAADEIKAVGAGIGLGSNAMQVFRHLGIHNNVAAAGRRIAVMSIMNEKFRTLSRMDLSRFEKQYGLSNYAIHRADLHQVLAEAVGHEHIALNKRVKDVKKTSTGFNLLFEDGATNEVTHIIGADGIKSKVRETFFGEGTLRDAKQLCWRGVLDADLPASLDYNAFEAWSKGTRFGVVKMNSRQVYWYLLIDEHLGTLESDVEQLAKAFHPLAQDLVENTDKEGLIKTRIYDLKPIQSWSQEGICLIGDAAHATTPNLGQGACQAIEDAYVLGELLKKYDINTAFNQYPKLRMKKASRIVKQSWILGKVAHISNPVLMFLRNLVMRLTPATISLKQLESLFKITSTEK